MLSYVKEKKNFVLVIQCQQLTNLHFPYFFRIAADEITVQPSVESEPNIY